jgi:hypothetical protein
MSRTGISAERFILPASSGSTTDHERFFPGKTVTMDWAFRAFLWSIGSGYATPDLVGVLYHIGMGTTDDEVIRELNDSQIVFDGHRVCGILAYLGGEVGSTILNIPEGEDAINVVVGYTNIKGTQYVLFVEHEFKGGVDVIHLRARRFNQLGNDKCIMFLAFGS